METSETDFDVVIIGGGPAGLSAALWCADLGLRAAVLEREHELGGQLLSTFNAITNFLGRDAPNGREMRGHFLAQLNRSDITCKTDATISRADLASMSVTLSDGRHFTGRSMVIAAGIRRRKLDIPGAAEFEDRGILSSGVASKEEVRGRSVVIVGGGDTAIENALILSRSARKITVVHRRSDLTARRSFVDRLKSVPNIHVLLESKLCSINGSERVEAVELEDPTGSRTLVETDHVLIRIGVVPNTEPFRGQVMVDAEGYINIDHACCTNVPGVFAIGDIANPLSPTISTAVGNGATAIKAAIALIHRPKPV